MKNDLNGVRTAQDLERKYNLGDIETIKEVTYKNNDTLIHVNNELNDFVAATEESLEDLQEQIDGDITTWFYNGVPALNNEPAVNWTTTEEKNRHLGDLYYDQSTGYAYRFTVSSNVYSWLQLSDSAVAEALALASAAQDTADNKRRVFMAQPTPPYDRGDLWINNNEIYICNVARSTGSYQSSDFIHNLKYTDDTLANAINEQEVLKVDSSGNLKKAAIKTAASQGTAFNVKADNINFQGKTFNLTTDSMAINSTNFSVDASGNMTCNNATINGTLEKSVSSTGTIKIGKSTGRLIEFNNTYASNDYYTYFAPNDMAFVKNNKFRADYNDNSITLYDNSGNSKLNMSGSDGSIQASGKVTAGNIDCGTVTLGYSDTQVNFNKTFANPPVVVMTAHPTGTTSGVIAAKIGTITTTGFIAWIGGTGSGTCEFCWIAIGT